MAMNNPKPTPPPRNRKARRKSSPGQVAFLEYKAVRDKAKAEREAKQRQDAWYLHHFHPEIAKAKRAKGVKNNAEASAWRRQMFVESFADWPSVLTADEMGYRIGEWLRDPSRSVLNFRTQRRKWKWRGCEKHFVKKEASVRKKLTELKVFRYNFRLRLWFKCGSVEEAEATQRLAEQEAERRRLTREEAERVERERVSALWEADQKKRQEAERLKAEAEQAERDRSNSPAFAGWHDFIPEELKPTALVIIRRTPVARGIYHNAQSLDDAKTGQTERMLRDRDGWVSHLQALHDSDRDRDMRRVAEAVLVAD
jgi:hypothetical protein